MRRKRWHVRILVEPIVLDGPLHWAPLCGHPDATRLVSDPEESTCRTCRREWRRHRAKAEAKARGTTVAYVIGEVS